MKGKYDIDKIIKEAAVADKQKKWFAGYFKRQFQRATNGQAVDFA